MPLILSQAVFPEFAEQAAAGCVHPFKENHLARDNVYAVFGQALQPQRILEIAAGGAAVGDDEYGYFILIVGLVMNALYQLGDVFITLQ